MSLRSYDGLISGIQNWLHRVGEQQLIDRAPEFLELVQDKINLQLYLLGNEVTSQPQNITDQSLALPDDFRGMRTVLIAGNPVTRPEYAAPASFWGTWFASEGGKPRHYTIEGSPNGGGYTISFGPWRTTNENGDPEQFGISYWSKFPELNSSNQTNWLTSNATGLLLYGALVEGSQYFNKPVADTAKWAQNYDSLLEDLQAMDHRQRVTADGGAARPWGVTPL